MEDQATQLSALLESRVSPYSRKPLIRDQLLRRAYAKALRLTAILAYKLGISWQRTARTFWGGSMTVTIPDVVGLTLMQTQYFDEPSTRVLIQYVRPGMTLFDVGAHVGYFSLLGSRLVGSSGSVHAFEPTPSTFALLRANCRGSSNVSIHNVAIWDAMSTVWITDHGPGFAAFNSALGSKLDPKTVRRLHLTRLRANAITIDDYVRETGVVPDIVKIDVEGAELNVINGMRRLLAEVRPILLVEVGDLGAISPGASRDCLRAIKSFAYTLHEWSHGKISAHVIREGAYSYSNILCLPRESNP